jgi:hypothetical protein
LYAAFGIWLRWGNSRVAALLSFSLALLSLGTTIAAKAGLTEGGKNIWLAVGVVWATAKAVEATFKLQGRFKEVSDHYHKRGEADSQEKRDDDHGTTRDHRRDGEVDLSTIDSLLAIFTIKKLRDLKKHCRDSTMSQSDPAESSSIGLPNSPPSNGRRIRTWTGRGRLMPA